MIPTVIGDLITDQESGLFIKSNYLTRPVMIHAPDLMCFSLSRCIVECVLALQDHSLLKARLH